MSQSLLRNFTHLVIPSEIWLHRNISLQAKCVWAELRSLHCKKAGGCYASDEYMMEFMQLKRSRLHEIYKELKEHGLMTVVSFDGRQTVRRAIVPTVEYTDKTEGQAGQQLSGKPDTENEVSGKPDSSDPENRIPPIYIENKEDRKDIYIEKKSSFVTFGSHVKLKKEEYEKLIKEHGQSIIDDLIASMNDYCKSSKPKGYLDYAAALRQWIKRQKTQSPQKPTHENPKDAIRKRQMDDYIKHNGSFDDNTLRF